MKVEGRKEVKEVETYREITNYMPYHSKLNMSKPKWTTPAQIQQ